MKNVVLLLLVVFLVNVDEINAQEVAPVNKNTKALWHDIPRAIRYQPDGEDIIIKNGSKRFNRALTDPIRLLE